MYGNKMKRLPVGGGKRIQPGSAPTQITDRRYRPERDGPKRMPLPARDEVKMRPAPSRDVAQARPSTTGGKLELLKSAPLREARQDMQREGRMKELASKIGPEADRRKQVLRKIRGA
jgi:hypothetical protein